MTKARDWLLSLRLEKGLTMKEVAIEAGIAESYYCLIESGERRPSPEVAQRIGDTLGFNWTQFYEFSIHKKLSDKTDTD